MSTLKVIKASMIFMGILIVIGFGLIINKIAQKNQMSNVKSADSSMQVILSSAEQISQITPCGANVCLLVTGEPRESRLYIVDPEKARVRRTIKFINQDAQ